MPRHKLLNYIGTIVAATVQIKVSNTINPSDQQHPPATPRRPVTEVLEFKQ